MEKKKKNIIIISLVISALLIIAGVICIVISSNPEGGNQAEQNQGQTSNTESKLNSILNKIEETKKYTLKLTLNNDNYKVITRNGEQAKIEIVDGGVKTTYTITDGNTYLKTEDSEEEYEYKNNISLLNDFENNLDLLLVKKFTVGTENIDNKNMNFEEFSKTSAFVLNYKSIINEAETKTRFYFDGNSLKYIKTYVGDIQQLLKVELDI